LILKKEFFTARRQELLNRIPEGTAVFLFAGKERAMTQDTDYRFLPDRNFFYMTGLEYTCGKLILAKGFDGATHELLFAPAHDELKERWHGKRQDFEELSEISGIPIENIISLEEYDERAYEFINNYELMYDGTSISEENAKFMKAYEGASDLGETLTLMRMKKTREEADAIARAAKLTEDALEEIKPLIRPGVTELELYTRLEYEMARRGSMIPAFETIVANGTNAFYLHHSDPEREDGVLATDGSFIQFDVGARCDGYCADISRVYFVGGEEDESDKRVKLLRLIEALRQEAWKIIRPGQTFAGLNARMREITGEFLLREGLVNEGYTDDDVKRYYWHNTSHHLGLDVHDISDRELPFEEGNCLAVEPGVYIKEWGVGFRIEDDVYVTADGCELLSSGLDSKESVFVRN